MRKFLVLAAAVATLGLALPAAPAVAQGISVQVGGDRGYHRDGDLRRDRGITVRSRSEYRPRHERVVIVKKKKRFHDSYGWRRDHRPARTVIIHR